MNISRLGGLNGRCCRPEQDRLWGLGCEHGAAPARPRRVRLSGLSALGCLLPESDTNKKQFHSVYIFLLVMQCSAAVDVLLLLDGSYSIGKGSFERSKLFAGKLCDALDIHPDRVSVRSISF